MGSWYHLTGPTTVRSWQSCRDFYTDNIDFFGVGSLLLAGLIGIIFAILASAWRRRGGLPSIALSWPITILCFQTTVVHTFSLLCMLSRRLRRSQVLLLANLALESQVIFLHIQFIWHFLRNWRRYRHLPFHYFSFWHNQTDRPSFQINRRPGPKSRHSSNRQHRWLTSLIPLCFLAFMTLSGWRGEGCDPAMGITEVPDATFLRQIQLQQGTKQHGGLPTMCERTHQRHVRPKKEQSIVAKRSIFRAYKRALQVGYAWYRGKLYSAMDFERMGCSGHHSPQSTTPSDALYWEWQQCNRKHVNKSRLNIWQWNSGGLASNTLDEVKAWLSLQCVDIGIIVETRLTFDSQWSDADWNIVHSGEGPHKGKGILILISRRLGSLSNMRWQFHESGRLVHARLQMNPRPIDIVACYQHTYNATKACLQARDKWWNKLDQVLGGIPNRNCLILAGDFNSSLPYSPGITGSSSFHWNGQA